MLAPNSHRNTSETADLENEPSETIISDTTLLRHRKKIEEVLDSRLHYKDDMLFSALEEKLSNIYGGCIEITILKKGPDQQYYDIRKRMRFITDEEESQAIRKCNKKSQKGKHGLYLSIGGGATPEDESIFFISGIPGKYTKEIMLGMRELRDQFLKTETAVHIQNQDPLTGLYNRFFIEKYTKERDTKNDKTYAVIAIDLYNLTGHNAVGLHIGDGVLKKVAEVLKSKFARETDIIARPGGDEFTIVIEFERDKPLEKQRVIVRDMMEGIEKILQDGENGKGTFMIEGEEREIALYWGAGYGDDLSFHQKHQNADRASKADKKLDSAAEKFSESTRNTLPTIHAIRTTLVGLGRAFERLERDERELMIEDLGILTDTLKSKISEPNPSKFKPADWVKNIREANQLDKKSGKE